MSHPSIGLPHTTDIDTKHAYLPALVPPDELRTPTPHVQEQGIALNVQGGPQVGKTSLLFTTEDPGLHSQTPDHLLHHLPGASISLTALVPATTTRSTPSSRASPMNSLIALVVRIRGSLLGAQPVSAFSPNLVMTALRRTVRGAPAPTSATRRRVELLPTSTAATRSVSSFHTAHLASSHHRDPSQPNIRAFSSETLISPSRSTGSSRPSCTARRAAVRAWRQVILPLSLIHISEPTRLRRISYAVFCL